MTVFEEMQREVEALVTARGDLTAASNLIYSTDELDDEERAALWLLGWSLLPEDRQRRAQKLAQQNMMTA